MPAVTSIILGVTAAAGLATSAYAGKRQRDRESDEKKKRNAADAALGARDVADDKARAKKIERERKRLPSVGAPSTVLTSPLGLLGSPMPAGQKTLLGS